MRKQSDAEMVINLTLMIETIHDKIKSQISAWTLDLQNSHNRHDIRAISFGAQKVYDGYELYLSGHTWYDEHDLWLLDEAWTPVKNYTSLGQESLTVDRLEVLQEYEKIIKDEIKNSKDLYKDLIIVVGLVDSDYKRLN